jgi:hypothetical protein
MKSELDHLWETPPQEREQRQKAVAVKFANPQLEKELLDLFDSILKRYAICQKPKEWIVQRTIENLINHITKYRSFCHSEDYIKSVVFRDYGSQVKLVTKRSMASWNRGRRFSYRIGRMIENNPHL